MRVIVTRPRAQAEPFVQALQALGLDAVALPLIEIAPAPDPAAVRAAWAALPQASFVMFVSANAVAQFFALRPPGAAWPPGVRAGATGPGTSAALAAQGLPPTAICEPGADGPFDSEGLWGRIADEPWAGRTVWVVRGEDGRDWLAERWRAAGAVVHFVAAYARQAPRPDAHGRALLAAALADPAAHRWHFSSSEAVAHLRGLAPQVDWSHAQALATHPRIAAAARAAGFGEVHAVGLAPRDVAQALGPVVPADPRPDGPGRGMARR